MKVKNILFSGFAAAIMAGACGAADAAAVSLISKDYADTELQAKLTAGTGIAISEDGKTISADGLAKQSDLEGVSGRVTTAEGKITTLEGKVSANEGAIATKASQTDLDAVSAVANAAAAKTYVNEELAKKQDNLVLGDNLQWVDGKLDTKGIATSAGLEALETTVSGHTTQIGTINTTLETKADKTTVAADIQSAVTTANGYTDSEIAKLSAEGGAIKELQDKVGSTSVADAIAASLADYTTTSDMNAALDLKADKTQVAADIKAVTDVMATDEEVSAAITALDLGNTYAAKSYEARVEANETAISNINSGAVMQSGVTAEVVAQVTTNKNAIAANAEDIKDLQESGFVVGTKNAGSYLVNFDANGVASYAAIQVLGANGQPVDLTTGAVK